MQNKYDSYGGNDGQSYDNVEIRMTAYSALKGEFGRAFGTESEYGQSLGVNMENVRLVDGALYYYPDKDRYKAFSWQEITGFTNSQKIERGEEPHADDADEVHVENYGNSTQTYELVAARVTDIENTDGETVVEASSKVRQLQGVEDGVPSFSEWTDRGGDEIDFHDVVIWYGGTTEYGPTTTAKRMLETITVYGSNSVVDEDDIYNWLPDASGDDILRDDLKDREVLFFCVSNESDNGYTYNTPVIEDVSTGQEIKPNNRDDGDSGNDSSAGSSSESAAVQQAREDDSGTYPEPVTEYISTGRRLNLTPDRATKLLESLVDDAENQLTEEMVNDCGGYDVLVGEVT